MHLKRDPIIEQDLVLVHIEEKPAFFARIEKITPDVKPKWWRVTFLVLVVPVKTLTWIIDDEQIRGADFTMGGTPIRIEKVVPPETGPALEASEKVSDDDQASEGQKKARVLSLHKK